MTSGFAIEKPRFGAPPRPNWITFPSLSIRCVVSLLTLPSAFATSGSARTFGRSASSNDGVSDASDCDVSNADFPLMMASEP